MAGHRKTDHLRQASEQLAGLWAVHCSREGPDFPPPGSVEYDRTRRAFHCGVALMRSAAELARLQRTAKRRPLAAEETETIARLLRTLTPRRLTWFWRAEEDAKVLALVKRRAAKGRPRPYERNGEVKRLAKRLGRSYMAVHRRMERLRRAAGIPVNCSNASEAPPGLN